MSILILIHYRNAPINSLNIQYVQAYSSLNVNYSNEYTAAVGLVFSKNDNSVALNYYNGINNQLTVAYNGRNSNKIRLDFVKQDNRLIAEYSNAKLFGLEINYENKDVTVLDVNYKLLDNLINLEYSSPKYQNNIMLDFTLVDKTTYQNSLTINYTLEEIPALEMSFVSTSDFDLKLSTGINLKSEISSYFVIPVSSAWSKISFQSTASLDFEIVKLKELLGSLEFKISSATNLFLKTYSSEETILIFTPDFELLAVLDNFQDFVWNRKWRKIDDYKLSLNRNNNVSKYLQLENYVAIKKGSKIYAGRIATRELEKNSEGENIVVSGKGLGEIFENRIAFNNVNINDGYDTFVGSAESAMKYYVNVNVINPTDSTRSVDNLINEVDREKGSIIHYKARFQKISEILYEIAKTTGLGWELQLDLNTKKIIFKVLTAKIRKGVRLNPEFDSVQMINFKENKTSNENKILIAGQGEGSNRMIRTIGRNEV